MKEFQIYRKAAKIVQHPDKIPFTQLPLRLKLRIHLGTSLPSKTQTMRVHQLLPFPCSRIQSTTCHGTELPPPFKMQMSFCELQPVSTMLGGRGERRKPQAPVHCQRDLRGTDRSGQGVKEEKASEKTPRKGSFRAHPQPGGLVLQPWDPSPPEATQPSKGF